MTRLRHEATPGAAPATAAAMTVAAEALRQLLAKLPARHPSRPAFHHALAEINDCAAEIGREARTEQVPA